MGTFKPFSEKWKRSVDEEEEQLEVAESKRGGGGGYRGGKRGGYGGGYGHKSKSMNGTIRF